MGKKHTLESIRALITQRSPQSEIIALSGDFLRADCKCKKCDYEWNTSIDKLRRGRGCPKCAGTMRLTLAQVKERVAKKSPNIKILSDTYINNKAKLDCKCEACGREWQITASDLLQGCGCRVCGNKRGADAKRYKRAQMQSVVEKVNPHIEVLSEENGDWIAWRCRNCGGISKSRYSNLTSAKTCKQCRGYVTGRFREHNEAIDIIKYVNSNVKIVGKYKGENARIECECLKCGGKWNPRFSDLHYKKSGCPHCAGTMRLTLQEVQNKISQNIEILSTSYSNNRAKLDCKCLKCSFEWQSTAHNLLAGGGCPRCGGTMKLTLQVFKEKLSIISPNIEIVSKEYKGMDSNIDCKCLKCGKEWRPKCKDLIHNKSGCPRCAKKESKIELDFLQNFKGWRKDRAVLKGRELDAYFEDRGFGIEVNGVYWHSEAQGKGRDYHLEKTRECEAQGIKLFHFFDLELQNKGEICKSMINNALGDTKRVFARECEVREISAKDAKEFCELNHIQGACIDKVRFGLFASGELISVMTFGKSRYNKAYEWELLRFCSKVGYSVVGGASKLLKAFERVYLPQSLVSYGNRRWCNSVANVYKALGFEYKGDTLPNYFYIVDGALQNRQNYQRHKLNKIFNYEFNEVLTENEIMSLYGYERVYDCGNLIYCKEYINGCA